MPMPVEIVETEITSILEIFIKPFEDHRGFVAETYNRNTWLEKELNQYFIQDTVNISYKGALRGLHCSIHPHPMGKLVRALKGSIYDVAVDLRQGSPTYGKYVGRKLSEDAGNCLWVPVGFAHGYVALEDSVVYYKCTGTHCPPTERTLHYKDPDVNIKWPLEPTLISEKDANATLFKDVKTNFVYELDK